MLTSYRDYMVNQLWTAMIEREVKQCSTHNAVSGTPNDGLWHGHGREPFVELVEGKGLLYSRDSTHGGETGAVRGQRVQHLKHNSHGYHCQIIRSLQSRLIVRKITYLLILIDLLCVCEPADCHGCGLTPALSVDE